MKHRKIILILWVLGFVPLAAIAEDRHRIQAIMGEELLIAGDYTPVGIFAEKNGQPSDVRVAYLELFNEQGIPVLQQMTYLYDGVGKAILTIPAESPSGFYLLRTYTGDSDYGQMGSVSHHWVAVVHPDAPPTIRLGQEEAPQPQPAVRLYGKREKVEIDFGRATGKPSFVTVRHMLPRFQTPVAKPENDESSGQFKPQRELAGHVMQVKGLEKGEHLFLSSMGKVNELYFGEVGENGETFIFMDSEKKYERLILQSTQTEGFNIASPFWEHRPKVKEWPQLEISEKALPLLKEMALNKELKKHFYLPDTNEVVRAHRIADAYASYNLDDYNRFETLALTFREYVPEVLLRHKKGKTELRMRNPGGATKENPLVILDGVPIFDIDAISNFNPKHIRRIEVSNRYYMLGSLQLHGIINLYSYHNDLAKFPLSSDAIMLDYPNPQPHVKLNFPTYGKSADRKPDLRTLLHWEVIETDKAEVPQVSFFTADQRGNYMATIHYLDENNHWQKEEKFFSVE